MAGKSDVWENELLKLLFNNTAAGGIGDANGLLPSATAGSFYLSLHTADPGDAGNQSTSETAYTNYVRQAVVRTSAGFVVTADSVALANNVDFPVCGATAGAAVTHFGIGDASSGAGKLRYSGALTPAITMAQGVIPRITTAAGLVTEA